MASELRLLYPVVAFCPISKQVVTIPAGSTLSVERFKAGLCSASWGGRAIFAQSIDIEENCVVVFRPARSG